MIRKLYRRYQFGQLLKLARILRRNYGGGPTYTMGQVRRAVEQLRIPLRLQYYAFALYLGADEYGRTIAGANDAPEYQTARNEWLDGMGNGAPLLPIEGGPKTVIATYGAEGVSVGDSGFGGDSGGDGSH